MTSMPETDAHIRAQALDVTQSFLIQAPAGSGKTELLIQRLLALISQSVNAPEEAVAITFTRKAASEMRERVMMALVTASRVTDPETLEPHQKTTWQLAKAVLQKDDSLAWGLLSNPNRLRIQTIDSLSASLARQSPLLSGFGCQPKVTTIPKALYEQAARSLLNASRTSSAWASSLEKIQRHLNNQLDLIEALIANMLARRDQWMPYLISLGSDEFARSGLEAALKALVEEHLSALSEAFPPAQKDALLKILRFSSDQLEKAELTSPILAGHNIEQMPGCTDDDVPQWLAIAELLFTSSNDWRKRVDKRQGFPAPSSTKNAEEKQHFKEMKVAHSELMAELQEANVSPESFRVLKLLPPSKYSDSEWQIIEALIELLPLAVAHLQLLFKNEGCVDFIEMAQRAEMALGTDDMPTELALKLDYQIKHLLVDEFQDTSIHQYRLLGRLVAEWEPYGERTVFLVGDPMQSIYRFRQAEVSLFIRLNALEAFEQLPLTPLKLFMNYRSDSAVVHWVNDSFQTIFPGENDPEFGAVKHEVAVPVRENSAVAGTFFHLAYEHLDECQNSQVLRLVTDHRQTHPEDSIAVLVRSRSHLQDLLTQFRDSDVPYHAQEIDLLFEQPLVQDLLALTKALVHLCDSVAWLSILRAPFIGLILADLETIVSTPNGLSIYDKLLHLQKSDFVFSGLSEVGQKRLRRCVPKIKKAINNHRRLTLSDRVERLWLSLFGPATLRTQNELLFAKSYLSLLAEFEEGSDLIDMEAFEERLVHLYAPSLTKELEDNPVHVMTMHKSKGLEFDLVILPRLEKGGGRDEQKLLHWSERTTIDGRGSLLLGPIKAMGEKSNPIYQFVQEEEKKRSTFERGRLLYVASTRAKKALHLFASVSIDTEGQIKKPKADALLTALLPQFDGHHSNQEGGEVPTQATEDTPENESVLPQLNFQLPESWEPKLPESIERALKLPVTTQDNPKIVFAESLATDMQQEKARIEGIFVHRILQAIVEEGVGFWKKALSLGPLAGWRAALVRAGLAQEWLDESIETVYQQIKLMLDDPKGLWILDSAHKDSATELEVSYRDKGQIKTGILDRIFMDKGVRWVIDYKSALKPESETKDAFLLNIKAQYAPQLNNYAMVISRLYPNDVICCGLYLPAIQGWIQWEPEHYQREEALI